MGDLVGATLVVAWALAGAVLLSRGRRPLGLASLGAAAIGTVHVATGSANGLGRAAHTLAACGIPATALIIVLMLPDGAIGSTARRVPAAAAATAAAAAVGLGLVVTDHRPGGWTITTAVVVALLCGLPSVRRSYLSSSGAARHRLQLVGCATAIVLAVTLVVGALRLLLGWPQRGELVVLAATVLVPLALAAGTSSRLTRGADRVLVHTVSATGLTAMVLVVYLTVVIGLGRSPVGGERTLLVLSMVAAAVVAIAYEPARARLTGGANRLVYGERHPPDDVLRSWGMRLSRAIPMEELLLQLVESLRKVVAPQGAEIWTGTGGRLELTVSMPGRRAEALEVGAAEQPIVTRAGVTGNAWLEVWLPALLDGRRDRQVRVAPASHAGRLLGLLVVERAAGADPFSVEDDRVLAELARQVGLALHNVQLDSALQESLEDLERANDDLRASRARIVATADAERRKIERNLHDGAQQHLVALAVNLRLTRDMLADDPDGAKEMLEALSGAVQETIQEVRDLAHGIYPPLLMDAGLPDALRAAANRSPLRVRVGCDGVGRLPTELEAAVYFCCLEALQNAAKHAPGASVDVRLSVDADQLHFEVSDDGPGFDEALARAGHGFVNMSDRVGAIGGRVEWRSKPGSGATVIGTVPLGGS